MPTKVNKEEGFRFNEATHRYYYDGKQMTGVTTILGVIAKPQLIKWAADMAVDYILEHRSGKDTEYDDDFNPKEDNIEVNPLTLEEARTAYAKKRDTAADLGTKIHEEVEQFIQCRMNGLDYFPENDQVKHFIDWADKYKVEFLDSEVQVYSKRYFVAGTYDFSCMIDGKKYMGDLKTGNALYPEYFYQCAAYRMMALEMGQSDFSGSILVRVGKDGKFNEDEDVIISESFTDEKNAFLAALKLYRTNAVYKKKRKGSNAI
jgi:hypothetical protein